MIYSPRSSITGGGISRLENNSPVSIDGSTFISTQATGTLCEVSGKGVLFLAWIDVYPGTGALTVTFDGGVSNWSASSGQGPVHAGYRACDLFVAGDNWLQGDGSINPNSVQFAGGFKSADDFKEGFNGGANVCASQHGVAFENGLKIEASGAISEVHVIYKLLD